MLQEVTVGFIRVPWTDLLGFSKVFQESSSGFLGFQKCSGVFHELQGVSETFQRYSRWSQVDSWVSKGLVSKVSWSCAGGFRSAPGVFKGLLRVPEPLQGGSEGFRSVPPHGASGESKRP